MHVGALPGWAPLVPERRGAERVLAMRRRCRFSKVDISHSFGALSVAAAGGAAPRRGWFAACPTWSLAVLVAQGSVRSQARVNWAYTSPLLHPGAYCPLVV